MKHKHISSSEYELVSFTFLTSVQTKIPWTQVSPSETDLFSLSFWFCHIMNSQHSSNCRWQRWESDRAETEGESIRQLLHLSLQPFDEAAQGYEANQTPRQAASADSGGPVMASVVLELSPCGTWASFLSSLIISLKRVGVCLRLWASVYFCQLEEQLQASFWRFLIKLSLPIPEGILFLTQECRTHFLAGATGSWV